ncbi:MAG: hypothetical protein IJV04_10640 [Lachnospiraceae bacterium]|nr:hypothetical protein [Lachnospiraceae bacterium]
MSRNKWKKLHIDTRRAADIEEKIAELAMQYDTGWHLDLEDSDIGSALARIFAVQMQENIDRVNDIMDRYHTEFVNMLDISLLPARPSSSIIVMNLVTDTIDGTGVAKGTKFLTTGETPCIFETNHSIYVTSSRIDTIFMTDGDQGSLIPIVGNFEVPEIYSRTAPDEDEEEEEELSEEALIEIAEALPEDVLMNGEPEPGEEEESIMLPRLGVPPFSPFTLFGGGEGIGKNAAMFYHPYLFDVGDDDLYVRFFGNEELVEEIRRGVYTFCYPSADGLVNVSDITLLPDGQTFMLHTPKKSVKVAFGQKRYNLLALTTDRPVEESRRIKKIEFSAEGGEKPAESVSNGINDLDQDAFAPFSDTLSLYQECYIGHNAYFGKAGARITLKFRLTFEENRISLTSEEIQEELKIIKPRPHSNSNAVYSDVFVDEIAVEYFNGVGWKRLAFDGEVRTMFDSSHTGELEISFICPADWTELTNGAYEGRSIRLQIVRADNCYLRPSVHHYPVIRDLKISYSYEERYMRASRMEAIAGLRRYDLSAKQYGRKGVVLFRVSEYQEDALYLGLTRRIPSGPVSILFELEDAVAYSGVDLSFEYSTQNGFRKMRVIDYTVGFTRSGVVAIVPPADWMAREIEGRSLFWLRLVRSRTDEAKQRGSLPQINNIALNAVEVSNIETREQEEVYIEEVVPNMRFALGATGVLDADVWVNEMGHYSQERMRNMYEEDPENIQIEQDATGVITAFYVRWKEVERVEIAEEPRVYQLDRLANELIFGDGIHTWIPRVVDDVAVRFTVRCCDGQAGNVPKNSITDSESYLMFIGSVTNPMKSYGGSNIEDLDNALERGASILSSRNRLVTMDDYQRAILAYSDTIDQVSGIVGETIDGEKNSASLTFILLMKEFEEGSFAFHRVVGGLKSHLLEHCELTVVSKRLHIVEPIFVEISVSIWVDIVDIDNSFEIQNLLSECLEAYLNPLGREAGRGWKIGVIPKKPQILMRMGILKSRAIVRKSSMVAAYSDATGYHEVALEELVVSPFMVCKSGKHQVHILY